MKNHRAFVSLGLALAIMLAAIGIGYAQGRGEPPWQPPAEQAQAPTPAASQVATGKVVSPTELACGRLAADGGGANGAIVVTVY